ncbi:MAG TPA: hypothetical protein VM285_03745 [Polyangia bacterium]|nr:hypothetical protein [Polyangia bacterium]HUW16018.1 hypothetical protein [Actinomycetes bacterium]
MSYTYRQGSIARPKGGRIKGSSTLGVEVTGVDGILKALRPWLEPELTRELDAANKIAAKALAKALKAEVRPVSKRMARAVRVKRARTGKPGWIVGSKRKIAFFWPFVIGGTKAHSLTRRKNPRRTGPFVRGVSPNPMVERVAKANERRIVAGIDAEMTKRTGS